jgi:hypothetical protein
LVPILFFMFWWSLDSTLWKIVLFGFIIWPVIWLISFIWFNLSAKKEKIDMVNMWSWNYMIEFKDPALKNQVQTSTTKYDYGWVRKYYSENTWIQFWVKSSDDIKIIDEIKKMKNETNELDQEKEKMKTMFSQDVYKITK